MSMHDEPAIPFNRRPSDDPMFRLQQQAENRARRNGHADPAKAGRDAMALRKLLVSGGENEPDSERILRTVAGEYRRA